MKKLVLPAILLFPLITLALWVYWGAHHLHTMTPPDAETVASRLQEFGGIARARLKPDFDAKQITYPPAHLILVGLKSEKRLEIYASPEGGSVKFIRSYPILAASGMAGPKLREGDGQMPEGIYAIETLNPNSKFHLSLRLNYPNAFDREQAVADHRDNLGGDIMIHGGASSVGCLAMGDSAAEDLFVLAADTGITNIIVILSPVDFRTNKSFTSDVAAWTQSLYTNIKTSLAALPAAE